MGFFSIDANYDFPFVMTQNSLGVFWLVGQSFLRSSAFKTTKTGKDM